MVDSPTRKTLQVTEQDLRLMVLDIDQVPECGEFVLLREGVLDNATLASEGFPGSTAESLRELGRITGYMKEFGSPKTDTSSQPGTGIMAATVAHLFDDRDAVWKWMTDFFLRQFEEGVGKEAAPGQKLLSVQRLDVQGFHDEAISLKAVHEGPNGLISSEVVDFRLGRLLGVAFTVAVGDAMDGALAERLGKLLEHQMVRVVLGAG